MLCFYNGQPGSGQDTESSSETLWIVYCSETISRKDGQKPFKEGVMRCG